VSEVEAIADFLKPFDARVMRAYPVSSRINQVQNDDEDYSKPVTPDPERELANFLVFSALLAFCHVIPQFLACRKGTIVGSQYLGVRAPC